MERKNIKIRQGCMVRDLYPEEDAERLVNRHADEGRRLRRRQERRLRQLEIAVNIALFGCITFALAAMLGLI